MSVADFLRSFNGTFNTVDRVADAFQEARDRRDMRSIADAKPEQSQGFTAEDGQQLAAIASAKDENGNPYYKLSANEDGSYKVQTANGSMPDATIAQRGVTDFMGQRTAGQMSEQQVNNVRQRAMAGVLMRRDPAAGARLMSDVTQQEQNDARFVQEQMMRSRTIARNAQVDDDEAALRQSLKTPEDVSSNDYLKTVAPRALQTLMSQGRVEDARHLQTYLNTEQGQRYANAWAGGVRRYAVGDTQGAMDAFQKLYNESFDDGHQIKLTALPKGKGYQADLLDGDGKVVNTHTGSVEQLLSQAVTALDPVSAAKFNVQQQAKRDAEEATLNRQLELERLRQEGRLDQEDRRDARLTQRLASQHTRGGLTAVQERGNLEIDAARERVAGMSPDEIRRRTAKATDTGRENKDFDPGLARAVNLAARRKTGADDWFDQRQGRAAPAAPVDRQDVAGRFRADPQMNRYRLGKQTPQGIEVLDTSGKLVGHYH